MTTIIERHRADIEALCHSYRVKRLDVFGSAIREDFDPRRSDVDFLVEFEREPDLNTFHAYMSLRDELSRLLGRPVDLVMLSGLRNRYLIQEVEATREPLYAA
jgi:predicted nucleotidyltransferase